LAKALVGDSRPVRLQVRGCCMEPLVRDGDWVVVSPSGSGPTAGMIALARTPEGELVCHRVLGRTEDGFRLAGDRSLVVLDHPREAVLGVIRSVERDGRVLRLDGFLLRLGGRLLAGLHILSLRRRGTVAGRVLERFRRLVLGSGGLAWLLARVSFPAPAHSSSEARRASARGAAVRSWPASRR
jgi:hypothetical protein